jgi:hypothetical protein
VPFTAAESDCFCMLSWQSWDWLVHLLATGTAEELAPFMCEAAEFVKEENRKTLVVIAQDATPVYLDASTGKILVRASLLKELRLRRVAKKLVEQGRSSTLVQLTGISKPSDAEGSGSKKE